MAQLGRFHGSEEMPHIEALAEAEKIPANYLVQILNDLRTAGLLVSRRGKLGGYALARSPEEISLSAIVQAVEGDLLAIPADPQGQSGSSVRDVWESVRRGYAESIDRYSVRDLMAADEVEMWWI